MHQENCVFCDLIKQSDKTFILESGHAFMVYDINPRTQGHALVITKKHFKNLMETEDEGLQDTIVLVRKAALLLLKKYPTIKGFNYISNQEKIANQVIFHTHIHIIPRY